MSNSIDKMQNILRNQLKPMLEEIQTKNYSLGIKMTNFELKIHVVFIKTPEIDITGHYEVLKQKIIDNSLQDFVVVEISDPIEINTTPIK